MNAYAPGMSGFVQWLANDPTGSQLVQGIAAPLAACCCASICGVLPTDAHYSAQMAATIAPALTAQVSSLPAAQQAPAAAALNVQLSRAAAGQPPLNVGMLEMGATRIKLGATCFYFGATTLTGGDLLLVVAGGALVVGLLLWHGRKGKRS